MGSSNSLTQIADFERDYNKQEIFSHPYFAHHYLLVNQHRNKMMICKKIIFYSSKQANYFEKYYQNIVKNPFSIIYPTKIIKNDEIETCSSVCEINIYLDLFENNLTNIIKEKGCFNENKAWFLLSQISKSLTILGENGRPHWAISPDNIYQNSYQNYFIYDNLFILGTDHKSFLKKKLQNNELMSPKLETMILKGHQVWMQEGFQEDCYCLGFVLLYALSGIYPSHFPKKYLQRNQLVKKLLQQLRETINEDLLNIIYCLIDNQAKQRIDSYRQLRNIIKERQADIIHNEWQDYKKTSRNNRQKEKININIQQSNTYQQMEIKSNNRHHKYPSMQNRLYTNNQLSPSARASLPLNKPSFSLNQPYKNKVPIQTLKFAQLSKYQQSSRSYELTRINSNNQLIDRR